MPFLIALVVLVGVLCVLDLLLTLGVIRRLRVHGEMLAARPAAQPEPMLAAGGTARPFSAVTVDGVPLSDTSLADPTLLGVFSTGCPACVERLPLFVERARAFPGGRDHVVAVVVGPEDAAAEDVRELRPVAHVVVEDHGGAVARAFRVTGFPSFALVSGAADGAAKVLASGTLLEDLGDLDAVAARR
ncbi:TlpA disulfide reductase family protein [Microbispora sp. NPDC088329]|uniref:TlpA family protein disulfide reductase n=1 Tax=Microbispora sp. NPDC088329 TaxID=3154869 RepID=UPI0034265B1A